MIAYYKLPDPDQYAFLKLKRSFVITCSMALLLANTMRHHAPAYGAFTHLLTYGNEQQNEYFEASNNPNFFNSTYHSLKV